MANKSGNNKNLVIKIPEGAGFIIDLLKKKGFEAYAVGGCVRDSLLGGLPADWDITTSAMPNDIVRIFKKAGCNVVPTGIKHGTITVIYKKLNYEITTYRIDGEYIDGRRPENVKFTANLKDDLMRRDFTINAMAYNDETGLIDYFGGISDLNNKIIKCVGNANDRFSEDYLRMLRAYRLAAVLTFDIDEDAVRVIERNRAKITGISAERIRTEFDKIILCNNINGIFKFFDIFLKILLPKAGGEQLKAIFSKTDSNLIVRLCTLFYESDSDTAISALKKLKYDNKTINSVSSILKLKDEPVILNKAHIKNILSQLGVDLFLLLNEFKKSVDISYSEHDFNARIELLNEIINNNEPYRIKDLAINGNDIMLKTGEKPNARIGILLNKLLQEVISDPKLNDKHTLFSIIGNYLENY